MGIRRRILLGFSSLAFLLFIAGVISYFELIRLNETTLRTIDRGAKGITVAKDALDLIEEQDILVLKEIRDDSTNFTERNNIILGKITILVNQLSKEFPDNKKIKELVDEKRIYDSTVKSLFPEDTQERLISWYFNSYKPAYRSFAHVTKDFMVETQNDVTVKAIEIKNHSYRTTMQGIAAICAAIVIIILFYFMIDLYFILPITTMTKSLKHYLAYKTPFEITHKGREEVYTLQTYIKQLISNLKRQ